MVSFLRLLYFFCSTVVPFPQKMSDGKCEQKGEGTALISGMPVVVQLSNSGSMGLGGSGQEGNGLTMPLLPLHSSHPWDLVSHPIN